MKQKICTIACIALSASLFLSACGPDLKVARQDFRNGDHQSALEQWTQLSDFGLPQAQLELARAYAQGRVTDRDLHGALSLINSAVSKNDPSQKRLTSQVKFIAATEFLAHGDSNLQDIGLRYLQESVDTGSPRALFEMARVYEEGYGQDKNAEKAASYYTQASDAGYARATYYHGRMFHRGRIVKKAPKKALSMYSKALEEGYKKAALDIGRFHERGLGTPIDLDQAIHYYSIASDNGIQQATEALNALKGSHVD